MSAAEPLVCYVVSHGFAARTVLHSGLVAALRRHGIAVGVISPNAGEPYFQELCTRQGVRLWQAPKVKGFVVQNYAPLRRYLFDDLQDNAALRAKHLFEIYSPDSHLPFRVRSFLGGVLNAGLGRLPAVRRSLNAAEGRIIGSGAARRLLRDIAPRLLVATYPVNWLEAICVREAQRLGVRTVGQLLSWDNITCKGRFAALPDRFVTWGPIMSEELHEHYGVDGARVVEAGVAHFDAHLDGAAAAAAPDVLRRLGLDPEAPYLFFGMSAAFFCPREIQVVEWLAERVAQGAFGPTMQLLVRPHPQNVRGSMVDHDVLERIGRLTRPRIAVDIPEVRSDTLAWDLDEKDLMRLSGILARAAVTLNSGSTLTIDALLHDRPVVLPLFDACDELPWWRSVRRVEEFPHLKKMLAEGGVALARSFEELEAGVRRYLEHPEADADGRRRVIARECGVADGGATERIAAALASMLA